MAFNRRNWSRLGGGLALVLVVIQAVQEVSGTAPPGTPMRLPLKANLFPPVDDITLAPGNSPTPAAELPVAPTEPLTLDELLEIAARNHPDLGVARAKVEAARGRLVQAGLFPNPVAGPIIDEMGNRHNAAGFVGAHVIQEIVTAGKLRLAQAAAARGVEAADWQALTRWYDVATKLRLAFYDLLTAQREVQVSNKLVELAQKNLDAFKAAQKGGTLNKIDILRADVEVERRRMVYRTAEQRLQAAKRLVVNATGARELPSTDLAGNLEVPAPDLDWQYLVKNVLVRSSEIQEAQAYVLQAEVLVKRAQREVIPNIQLQVRPLYNFIDQNATALINAGVAWPIYNRNQGNIAAARADLARALAEVEQVELRLTERLTLAFQRYQVARQQSQTYKKRILPNAESSLQLIRQGYKEGDAKYDLTALLQGQQTLAEAELAYVQSLGDLWRAVAELAGLLQQDELLPHDPLPANGNRK